MEKSTSTATQIAEPPPYATSYLSEQHIPLPTAPDQRSSPAMNLDSSPASTPGAAVQGQTFPTPAVAAQPHLAAQVPTPPSIAITDPSSRGRKRGLEGNPQIENSNYYKIRLLLKEMRPHVLEVLGTPDFRNCKAAIEIQQKMKLMIELYQEMIGETPKREKITKTESLSSATTGLRSSENEKQNSDGDKAGDMLVGGSAFGWNFITYGGTEAVYCGMTKEEYRSCHPNIQVEVEVELHNKL